MSIYVNQKDYHTTFNMFLGKYSDKTWYRNNNFSSEFLIIRINSSTASHSQDFILVITIYYLFI